VVGVVLSVVLGLDLGGGSAGLLSTIVPSAAMLNW